MSHTLGVICRQHERIMENYPCPERGCEAVESHGFTYADCDDRCPEHSIQSFKDLLEQSSFTNDGEGAPPSAHAALEQAMAEQRAKDFPDLEILPEDEATPAGHAWLDQFLAANPDPRNEPIDNYLDGLRFDRKFMDENGINPK